MTNTTPTGLRVSDALTWIDYLERHDYYADALVAATSDGWALNAHADPTADAVEDCSVEYAAEVAAEDPSLVYLTRVVTITTRARSLGYGWSATPSGIGIKTPVEECTGGLRTVERARARAAKRCSGGVFWREALFVGGHRVLSPVGDVISELRRDGNATVRLAERGPR